MPSRYTMTFRDYTEEASSFSADGQEWTELNFAAVTALIDALRAAVKGITLGSETKEVRVVDDTDYAYVEPVQEAQRETKWLVGYHDSVTGKKFTSEMPCADLTLLDPNNKGYADMTDAAVTAFVSAFENFVRTEAGNGIDVDYIRHVGRNI